MSFLYITIQVRLVNRTFKFFKTDKYTEDESEKLNLSKKDKEKLIMLFNKVYEDVEIYNNNVKNFPYDVKIYTVLLDNIVRRLGLPFLNC